jgi:pyrroloquinoline quinone (PQQ) biosynthesis protein C
MKRPGEGVFERLQTEFRPVLAEFLASEPMQRLTSARLTVAEYRSVLREIFHHTRENPQMQALATVYFKGRQRDAVRAFYAHAASEIGHDQLALNDFVTLGGDPELIPYQNPLPATTALLAYGFYQIYNLNPLGYLGYLFFLEFTGTAAGTGLMDSLRKIGVPDSAMSFLRDHTEIDVGHNRLMQKYCEQLLRSDEDVDCVLYAMKTTGYLYSRMIHQAIEDASSPMQTGWNWQEIAADSAEGLVRKRFVA